MNVAIIASTTMIRKMSRSRLYERYHPNLQIRQSLNTLGKSIGDMVDRVLKPARPRALLGLMKRVTGNVDPCPKNSLIGATKSKKKNRDKHPRTGAALARF